MKNRYNKLVFESEKGITSEVSAGTSGELVIRAMNIATANVYSENHMNPPIPKGWQHVEGKWNNGFVIADHKKNQFVWVPVGFLDANGTLDGTNFSEKFGRREYYGNEFFDIRYFSDSRYNEELDDELRTQWESVKKYGGFYISRYNISKNKQTGEAQSVKGEMPWVNISWNDSMREAKNFGDGVSVTSHLPYGAENDSTLEWFIKSGARTKAEITIDSSQWGNFWDTKDSPKKIVKTGTREEWSTNCICDFAGNVSEWTQEKNMSSSHRAIRGGTYNDCGDFTRPVCSRCCAYRFHGFPDTGFRATLYIK